MKNKEDEKEKVKEKEKGKEKKAKAEAAENGTPALASDYEFIREQIRERPINKKKLARRFLLTAGLALIFGLVACLTILVLEPMLSRWLSSEEDMELKQLSLAENSEDEENITLPLLPDEDEESEQLVIETPIDKMNLTDEDVVSANQAEPSVSENRPTEAPTPTEAEQQPQIVYEQVPLELEDYRQLYRKLYALSGEVKKSLVTVTAVSETMDWSAETDASAYQTTGMIVGENGRELLILADSSRLTEADTLRVTFCDGSRGELYEKVVDPDTELGIYAIQLMQMRVETRAVIQAARLGSSYANSILGNAVMAVGNPLGSDSICYGAVTSCSRRVSMCDASYQILTTDIYGSSEANGVIVNIRGQIAGFITQAHCEPGMENLVHAYGISSIRKLIEDLSNGRERPWLGLTINDVTAEAAEALGIPEGVYVSGLEIDSPAMGAGLARGDIICGIGTEKIVTTDDFMNVLQSQEAESEVLIEYARYDGEQYRKMNVTLTLGKR